MSAFAKHESRNQEIDLVDLWLVFRRHQLAFWAAFLAVVAAGMVVVGVHTPKYTYSLAMQVGGVQKSTGFVPVAPPIALRAVLDDSLIPETVRKFQAGHPLVNVMGVAVSTEIPVGSNTIVLQVQGTAAQGNMLLALLSQIETGFANAENPVLQLQTERKRALLTGEIQDMQVQLSALQKNRAAVISHGDNNAKALTFLLINSQIAELQKYIFNLNQELQVDLPANAKLTAAMSAPARTLRPVGLSATGKIAIFVFLGLMAGLVAVLAVHLRLVARERMRVRSAEGTR